MVFSLFGRNKATPESGLKTSDNDQRTQLRTPSPSASVSIGTAPPQSPEVAPIDSLRGVKRSRPSSPVLAFNRRTAVADEITGDTVTPPASPAELLARVRKVPAKTLHSYVVTHLPHAPLEVNEALMQFFATLVPPPRLHCVRCHKDYAEVENTDRSCLVPHDDESAVVEYLGNSKSNVPGVVGSTYETTWGCCNKVVEGDGDQGPPDGWCFEGFHTTDIKRARFRADSTIHDDKLISCRRMRCSNSGAAVEGSDRGRSQRAAARKSLREASDDEEDYDERELVREARALAEGSDGDEAASLSVKKNAPKSHKRKSDAMELELEDNAEVERGGAAPESVPVTKPKIKSKTESMKPKSVAKSKEPTKDPASPSPHCPAPTTDGDVDMDTPEGESKPKSKKPRKPRKSTNADGGKYVPPKAKEDSSDFDEEEEKPKRKRPKRKSNAPVTAAPS